MCPKVGGRSRRVQKFVSMESSGACRRNNRKAPSSSFFKPKSRSYAGRLEKALGKEPRSMWMRPRYCMFSTYWLTETRDTWPRSRTSIRPLFIEYNRYHNRDKLLRHTKNCRFVTRNRIRSGTLLRRVVQRQRDCPLQGRLVRKGGTYRTIVSSSRGKNSFPVLWPYTCISHVAQSLSLGLMDQRFVLGTWPQVQSSSHDCALSTSEGSIMEQPRGFQRHCAE
jgi:hypothetical protein